MKKRITWVDTAKGIGILLVVLDHILTSYVRRSGCNNLLSALPIKIVLGFFMPLFFFLSGIFIGSVLKKDFFTVFKTKFKRLMIPYFFWGIISVAFYEIYSKNLSIIRFLELPFRPIFVLWFVYSLFIIILVFYLLQKAFKIPTVFIISIFMFVLGNFISVRFDNSVDSWTVLAVGLLRYFIFVYLGFLSKDYLLSSNSKMRINLSIILSLVALFILNIISVNIFLIKIIIELFIGISGIIFVCNLSMLISSKNVVKITLARLGELSMQIYLVHKLVVEVVSIAVFHFTSELYLYTVFNLIITLIISFLAIIIINKLKLNRLFWGI